MRRRAYPTDLSNDQWNQLESHFPVPKPVGRRREHSYREIMDAILYMVKAGCQWRLLPHDFPKWKTVYGYFNEWSKSGFLLLLNRLLAASIRTTEGRNCEPSAASIDWQSVKSSISAGGERGFDGNKKVMGRKRHILVDTNGFIMAAHVASASAHDSVGGIELLKKIIGRFYRLTTIFADQAYGGCVAEYCARKRIFDIEVIRKDGKTKGFELLPKRWVVERTFSWISSQRRCARDYERTTTSAESWIYVAMIGIMARRY